jgi:type I restriction enzyme S subunit
MNTLAESADATASGQLPPGWRMSTIGELLKVRNGFAFKSTDYQEEGALLIRQSNLDGSRVSIEKAKYLPKSYLQEYRDFLIKKGDILIGMSGSIGKLCTYDRDEPALQNQRTGLLVFKGPEQKRWVWHYLPLLEKDLTKAGKGVAVLNVSASQIESFPIPVAPLDQQKRIVAEIEKQFSRLDEAVANLKRVKANLKRYKAAVLKAAVEGRLVETEAELARKKTPSPLAGEGGGEGASYETGAQLLQRTLETRRSQWKGKGKYKEPAAPDTTDLPELPEGWVWASLDQLSTQIADVDHKMPKAHEGGIPYVSTKDFRGDNEIDFEGAKRISVVDYDTLCRKVRPVCGDILLSRYGTVGEVRVVTIDVRFQASYSVAIVKPVTGYGITDFIAIALRSDVVQSQIKRDV